jgi:hypothetical protein
MRSRWTESNRVEFGVLRLWSFADLTFGPAPSLTIRVEQPETEHMVSVGKPREAASMVV